MKNFIKDFGKSIAAGAAIAIGAMIFCSLNGGIAGAIFFSVGLYLVLWFNLNLYTGKVGYINSVKKVPNLLLIFLGNALGCTLAFIMPPAPFITAVVAAKLSIPPLLILIKSIICGILIYAGVDQYKKNKDYAPLVVVPAFILVGAEHSIADICYLIIARCFSVEALLFIFIVAIGNAIGSLLWRFLT